MQLKTTREERSTSVHVVTVLDEHFGIYSVRGSTGNSYTVDACMQTCTCPDFVYRMSREGGKCKHIISVEQHRAKSVKVRVIA